MTVIQGSMAAIQVGEELSGAAGDLSIESGKATRLAGNKQAVKSGLSVNSKLVQF